MKFHLIPYIINTVGKGQFWKQLGMMVLSTTISLSLTLAVAAYMEKKQRARIVGSPP